MQRYLITEKTIEPIEGNKNKILIDGVIYTSGEIGKKLNISTPLISKKMTKYIDGKILFSEITSSDCRTVYSIVDGKKLSHFDLEESTGYTRTYIQKKMHQYNDGKIDANELQKIKGTGKLCKGKTLLILAPKKVVKEKKARQTPEEIREDYRVQLRKHRLSTCNQTLGGY